MSAQNVHPCPAGIECQCCREMEGIADRLTDDGASLQCLTDHKQFKVVCLNKDVLYTALVMMKLVLGDTLRLPLANTYCMAKANPLHHALFIL